MIVIYIHTPPANYDNNSMVTHAPPAFFCKNSGPSYCIEELVLVLLSLNRIKFLDFVSSSRISILLFNHFSVDSRFASTCNLQVAPHKCKLHL
jgi:hypothetical protein